MYGGIGKLVTQAGRTSEVLDFLRWDAEVAETQEPGTLRFDVWQRADEADVVYLYEAYVDHDAFEAHKANDPFKRFIEEIVPSLAEPPTFVEPFTQSFGSNADDSLTHCRLDDADPAIEDASDRRYRRRLSASRLVLGGRPQLLCSSRLRMCPSLPMIAVRRIGCLQGPPIPPSRCQGLGGRASRPPRWPHGR